MALDPNVLAQSIGDKLDALSRAAGKGPLPDLGKADRDMLFSAIAQAIVDHLTVEAVIEVSDINLNVNPATGIIK